MIGQYGATDDLQEAACGALSNMAAPEPEYRRLAVAEGLYPAVTKILLRPRILPDGLRGAAAGALAVAAAEPGTERSAAANALVKAASECLAKPGASESLALAALARDAFGGSRGDLGLGICFRLEGESKPAWRERF